MHLQMSISGQTGRRRGNMGGHLDVDRVTWKRFPLCRFLLSTLIQLALGYTELRSVKVSLTWRGTRVSFYVFRGKCTLSEKRDTRVSFFSPFSEI